MLAAVATLTTSAPARSGRSPSTVVAACAPATWAASSRSAGAPPRAASARSGRPRPPAATRRAGRRGPRPRRRPGSRGPAPRPCRRRCRAGRRRRPATGPRPRGCPRPADAPAMSSASLTITPSNPSSSRSRPSTGALSVAGQRRVEAGYDDVRGHHRGDPGPDGRRERHQLAASAASTAARRRSAARGGCPARCRRARGSAWRRPRRPAAWSPSTHAATCAATRSGSVPKLRVPITGLSGLVFTSATGPRSRSMPTAASSAPIAWPVARVRSRSSAAPSAAGPSTGLPVSACSRVTSPPSSSTATTASGAAARIEAVSAATASGRRRCCCRTGRPRPSPRRTARAQPSGSVGPGKAGQQHAAARGDRGRSSLHRPGREAGDHPALHDQEEDDHRAARSASSRP